MQTIGNPNPAPDPRSSTTLLFSVAGHVLVLLLFAFATYHASRVVAPYRLPGTEHGTNFVLAYLPNRAPPQSAAATAKAEPKITPPKDILPTPAPPRHTTPTAAAPDTTSPPSPNPNATSGADALGSGNITIAFNSYFPTPKPNLSVLPHGTKGDVILEVVIDANGRISDLKLASGVGFGVDEIVMATVQQWTFRPATQNGHPIASEQEIHFHYERS